MTKPVACPEAITQFVQSVFSKSKLSSPLLVSTYKILNEDTKSTVTSRQLYSAKSSNERMNIFLRFFSIDVCINFE